MNRRLGYGFLVLMSMVSAGADAVAVGRVSAQQTVRDAVQEFVLDHMLDMFTAHERSFTARYRVRREGDDARVIRIPSASSISTVQADARFEAAVEALVHHLLDIYDDHGAQLPIDVYSMGGPNSFCFVPLLPDSMADAALAEIEDDEEDDTTRAYLPDSDDENV
ncbi:MAG: hypothetical protein M1549_03180 [Candidatus Dependentiae bacterium]|nr:hypothetical protein [Candidatus Dependentiae bacterium]